MFLALKEMKYEKFRYGLITFMIFLVSYLIFFLSSLALGLASQNTQAIKNWQLESIVLNSNSNTTLAQSSLTKKELQNYNLTKKDAYVGEVPVVVKSKNKSTISAQFMGIKKDQFVYKGLSLLSGRKSIKGNEVTVDRAFKDQGYELGDEISFNGGKKKYKIVGFLNNAKLNIAPLIYGNMKNWRSLKPMSSDVVASGVVSQRKINWSNDNVKTYSVKTYTNNLPGYTAQNATFQLMIGFLFVISLIVVAVFLYILTMQKLPNYAVLRAQGIPAKTLIMTTITQSIILTVIGSVLACLLMYLTAAVIPAAAVPIYFANWVSIAGIGGMILVGIIGGLIPIKSILKVNPADAIS